MVEFDLDKQTIKDLEIFGDSRSVNTISNFYNQTKTYGGKSYLYQLMKNPITDIHELRQRTELIQFISETGFELKIPNPSLNKKIMINSTAMVVTVLLKNSPPSNNFS